MTAVPIPQLLNLSESFPPPTLYHPKSDFCSLSSRNREFEHKDGIFEPTREVKRESLKSLTHVILRTSQERECPFK